MGERINKNNKAFFILVFSIILVQLIISLTNAEIVGSVDNSLNFSPDDTEKIRNIGIGVVESLENFNLYAQANFQKDLNNQRAVIRINEETGLITIEAPPGTFYAEIPKGVNLDLVDNKLVFSGTIEPVTTASGSESWDARTGKMTRTEPVSERPSLKINGFEVNSENTFKVEFSEENGVRTVKLIQGKTDIKIGETILNGISKATLKLNNKNQLVFADFISPNGGDYSIVHNGKNYHFIAGKNGRVIFDPLNGIISGENTQLYYKKERKGFNIEGKFEIIFNEKGEPLKLILTEGFYSDDIFGGEYSVDKKDGPLAIYLDGREIRNENGNALSFDYDQRVVKIKGKINAVKIDGSIQYNGLESETYTELHANGKDEDLIPYFDVNQGDAKINNKFHEIYIKDGHALLKIKNGNAESPVSFRFSSYTNTGDRTEGLLNEDLTDSRTGARGIYQLEFFNSNGERKVSSVPLSLLNYQGSLTTQQIFQIENSKQDIQNKIFALRNNKPEGYETEIALLEDQLHELNGLSYDERLEKLKGLLDNNRISPDSRKKLNERILNLNLGKAENELKTVPFEVQTWSNTRNENTEFGLSYKVRNGEIVAIKNYYGEWVPVTNSDGLSEISKDYPGQKKIIEELKKRGWSSEALGDILASNNYGITNTELLTDSVEYRRVLDQLSESRSYALERLETAKQTGNLQEEERARIDLARTYYLYDRKTARELLEDIKKSGQYETLSAERELTMLDFKDNPKSKAVETVKKLQELYAKGDTKSGLELMNLAEGYIQREIGLARDEAEKILEDRIRILGREYFENENYQHISESVQGAVSKILRSIRRSEEQRQLEQENLLDENDVRRIGLRGFQTLYRNRDTVKYFRSSDSEQLATTIELNGLDRYVSLQDLRRYMQEQGLSFSLETAESDAAKLIDIIEQEKGPAVAKRFREDLLKAIALKESIYETARINPSVYILAGGHNLPFYYDERNLKINEAFTSERAGSAIEMTAIEKVAKIADVGVAMLGAYGVSGIAIRTIPALGYLAPVETATGKSGFLTGFLDTLVQVSGTEIIGAANPKFGEFARLLLDVGVGMQGKLPTAKLLAARDALGKVNGLFIEASSEIEIRAAREQLIGIGGKKISENSYRLRNGAEVKIIGNRNEILSELTSMSEIFPEDLARVSNQGLEQGQREVGRLRSLSRGEGFADPETDRLMSEGFPGNPLGRRYLSGASTGSSGATGITTGTAFASHLNLEGHDGELTKYLLGRLETGSSHERHPVDYPGGLERLIDDWVAGNPTARNTVSDLKRSSSALIEEAKNRRVGVGELLEDLRHLEDLGMPAPVSYHGRSYSYFELKSGSDFHDLARNMEMRESLRQVGITTHDQLESALRLQISSTLPVDKGSINIDGKTYTKKTYSSEITGNGKRFRITSVWHEDSEGNLILVTIIADNIPKRDITGNPDLVDRLPIFRSR